jgi:hypothetical protein
MMIEHVTDVQVLRAPRGGVLRVRSGQVWITRRGDPTDHVLSAGDSLRAGAGQCLYLEPWQRGSGVDVDWQPHAAQSLQTEAGQQTRRVLAGWTRSLARRLEALARRMEAQGRCAA